MYEIRRLRRVLDRLGWWTDQCQHGFYIPQCPWDRCVAKAALKVAEFPALLEHGQK